MSTPDYTKKMSDLRTRVNQHAKLEGGDTNTGAIGTIAAAIPKINTQSILFYAAPPVILTIVFLFMKPGFVCVEHKDEENGITNKMSYKKVLIAGLISGTVISIGLFAYFRQKKT